MKYIDKKPRPIVDVIQWNGSNEKELYEFCGSALSEGTEPLTFELFMSENFSYSVELNDWIVKHANGSSKC
jgi:hypothetical protein